MKSRILVKSGFCVLVAASTLAGALAIPVRPAAQEQQNNNHHKHARYALKVLGTLGGTFGEAWGVNKRGSMAGHSTLPGDTTFHAFFWRKGVMTDLGTLGGPNSNNSPTSPVNDRGAVSGFSDTSTPDPNGEDFCGFGTNLVCLPFVWQDGAMTPLPTLGGNNAAAGEINNRGQVVGMAENSTVDPTCFPPQVLDFEAVVWGPSKGQIQELYPLPGDTEASASGINDNGLAVGTSGNCSSGPIEAVLWRNNTPTNLGNLGGTFFNIAFDINNQDQVVGQSNLPGDTTHHAFLWTEEDGMQDLGTLPGLPLSLANGINSKGQVVGFSQDANGDELSSVAFLWQDDVMTNLNTLIAPSSPLFLMEALSINDSGQIAGFGRLCDGEHRGFLLTPCVEGDDGCGEGGGENAVLQASPAPRDAPKRTLPPSLVRRMDRYHFPGPGFGPRN